MFSKALDEGKEIRVIFFDISKAFDRVWHMVYKDQLSRQTGSRNLTGPKTLPTIWYTYMMLVTKYQISAINSY
jgi:hypothetical protein